MSLRYEQHQSLLYTRELLYDLLHHSTRPKTVAEMKKRVAKCLRHFPHLRESGEPIFSNDNWER